MDYEYHQGGVLTQDYFKHAAFFEHSYLAERSGAILAMQDLVCERTITCITAISRQAAEVGCVYRRISYEYLDSLTFL